jgi:hypothetical protein
MDDAVLLDPLREALTSHLGEPQDATMTPQSNTQLQWRSGGRLVEIMADIPAITPNCVYSVIIKGL